jgi:hypothetical protein
MTKPTILSTGVSGVEKGSPVAAGAAHGTSGFYCNRYTPQRRALGRYQHRHHFPGIANLNHQLAHFGQRRQIVVDVHMQQPAGDIGIQLAEIACQIAAFFMVQRALQANHNAAGTGQVTRFFHDGFLLDMPLSQIDALEQPVQQHLDQFDAVRGGNPGLHHHFAVIGRCLAIHCHQHVAVLLCVFAVWLLFCGACYVTGIVRMNTFLMRQQSACRRVLPV